MAGILDMLHKEIRTDAAVMRDFETASLHGSFERLSQAVLHHLCQLQLFRQALEMAQVEVGGLQQDKAVAEKEKGNLTFDAWDKTKNGDDLVSACQSYTECLRLTDATSVRGAKLAAIAYSNRALCLLRMDNPAAARYALADCDCALECNPNYIKAWHRRSLANEQLGKFSAAVQDAQAALNLCRDMESKAAVSLQQHTDRLRTLAHQQQTVSHGNDTHEAGPQPANTVAPGSVLEQHIPASSLHCIPDSTIGSHDAAPSANSTGDPVRESYFGDHLRLETWDGEGRLLVAQHDIAAGTELFSDQPFAAVVNEGYSRTHCSWCFRALPKLAPVPCRRCSAALYCDRLCRDADVFHRDAGSPECGFKQFSADTRLAIRMAAKIQQKAQGSKAALQLEHHMQHIPPETLLATALDSSLATAAWRLCGEKCWRRKTGQESYSKEVLPRKLDAGDVLRAALQIHCNQIAILDSVKHSNAGNRVGTAIYLNAAMLNHSCVPNTTHAFDGQTITVRASSHVPAGTPVLISYGPQKGQHITPLRQVMLRQSYHFRCACPACREGRPPRKAAASIGNPDGKAKRASPMWLPPDEARAVGLRCRAQGCRGGAVVPSAPTIRGVCALQVAVVTGTGRCCSCQEAMPFDQQECMIARLTAAAAATQEGLSGPSELRLQLLLEELEVRRACLHRDNETIGDVESDVAEIYAELGRHYEAVLHCQRAVENLEARYPPGSTQVAFEKNKLAKMMTAAAAMFGEEAKLVLRNHFGNRLY